MCIDFVGAYIKEDNMAPVLTIHTATYNRAYILEQAYKSLKKQTCFEFEWLITDDGSTDETKELVAQWLKENNQFPIRYIQLEHGGLIRAINHAIAEAEGEYYFRLDSDDYLTEDAVETILEKVSDINDNLEIVGVGFVIIYENGQPIKGVWPDVNENGYVDCTNLERKLYNLDADMQEAYKIDIIKKYPFPVWEGEMFAPEQLQTDAMALDGYKVRWHSKAIYVREYIEDGLTKGNWNLLRNNKMGYAMLSNQRLLYERCFGAKFRAAAQHIALSIVAGYPSYILKSNKMWFTLLAIPYGVILSFRRREQFKWDDPINRRNY